MAGTRSSRRQQSRLTFTPLPSSSPAAKGYNAQIQSRAAAVSIDSPAKRRKISNNSNASANIPTPAASHEEEDGGSESEPVRSTQRKSVQQATKKRSRATQKPLDFSSSRDPESFSSPVRLASSPSRPQSSAQAGMFTSQRSRRPVVDVSSEESDEELPSVSQLATRKKRSQQSKGKSGSRRTRSTQPPVAINDSSDDDVVVTHQRSDPINIESDEEDEEDEMPTTTGTQRRKRQRRGSHNSFISSSPPRMASSDSDSDIEIIERPRKRARAASEDDEDEPTTPRRKMLSQQEKEELAEDIDFLKDSGEDDAPRGSRATQSGPKNARMTALEQLRRKRAGAPATAEEDGEEGEDKEQPEESRAGSLEEENDDADAGPMSSARFFREDEYDAEFVEEGDEDEPLGIPSLPIKYSRYAKMRPKELFEFAVEWMVQKKINPAFDSTDEVYELTFRKLNDETKGLVKSKFVSSVWTQEFAIALQARPDFAEQAIPAEQDTCDACNRTGHPATFEMQFQGKPYHPETLEEVDGNDAEDEDDDDVDAGDRPGRDADGRVVEPENRIFRVGKFCRINAITAHPLQHWRHHLNEVVVEWLVNHGYNTPQRIVERDGWSIAKRGQLAQQITDRMKTEGVIKELWKTFSRNVDDARNAKQGGRARF
ncbi:uncharacterized protein LTR77_007434 [Saxophila tyrrhenica]|uniref:DUF4211 domain-containing protein n=1 Tax=Saxophila tyrrhenica TaxID=1690608 RepID=A0AAV9P8P8_9PEZI|nr:hypothetical protein LTR77_007434 [Saxophila tyrrhenica]